MYQEGLIIGKFMPVHRGHLALIDFALSQTQHLIVAVSSTAQDVIALSIRLNWLRQLTANSKSRVTVVPFSHQLPHDGVYRQRDSELWCREIKQRFATVDVFFSSEAYGDILAAYMSIDHVIFDKDRYQYNISATQIRRQPSAYREYLPDVVWQYFQGGNF